MRGHRGRIDAICEPPLTVSPDYHDLFVAFLPAFEAETAVIGDDTLEQEAAILEQLIAVE